MPELPEVQTIVSDMLDCGLVGRMIVAVETDWPRMLAPLDLKSVRNSLVGAPIKSISRRGKFIVVSLPNLTMLMHLRMSGRIYVVDSHVEKSAYVHFAIRLDDGREIRFHDTRKFGRVYFFEDPAPFLARLGVEPLGSGFTLAFLRLQLLNRSRMIKPLLLDQSIISGLGNIYVDEALWHSGVHPQSQSNSLSDDQIKRLRYAIPSVLRRGIKNRGTSLGNGYGNYTSVTGRAGRNILALKVYGRADMPCLNCGELIQKITVAQRGTHFCPACQPLN